MLMAIEAVQRSQGGRGGQGATSSVEDVQAPVKHNVVNLSIFFYFVSKPAQHPPPFSLLLVIQ
jgi:hypothetical protein